MQSQKSVPLCLPFWQPESIDRIFADPAVLHPDPAIGPIHTQLQARRKDHDRIERCNQGGSALTVAPERTRVHVFAQ